MLPMLGARVDLHRAMCALATDARLMAIPDLRPEGQRHRLKPMSQGKTSPNMVQTSRKTTDFTLLNNDNVVIAMTVYRRWSTSLY